MNQLTINLGKRLVVAVTLTVAALASWHFTNFQVPTIEIASAQSPRS